VLPYLPPSLEALLPADADLPDVCDVLALMTQLAARFKAGLAPLASAVLPALLGRVHSALPPEWDWTGARAAPQRLINNPRDGLANVNSGSEEIRERGDLQRAYYLFLHSMAHGGLANTLLGGSRQAADAALGALLRGAGTHVDPGARKICIQTMEKLIEEWLPVNGSSDHLNQHHETLPGFRDFVVSSFACEALVGGLAGGAVDARDAGVISLLAEAAAALKLADERSSGAVAARLAGEEPLGGAGGSAWSRDARDRLAVHVAGSDAKALKDYLMASLQQMRGPSGQSSSGGRAARMAARRAG
jgi:exportin-T